MSERNYRMFEGLCIKCLSLIIGELYTEAADGAMAAMKGRLANKYYALAEEAWAQVEDGEE